MSTSRAKKKPYHALTAERQQEIFKKAQHAFLKGDPLSDRDLEALIHNYRNAVNGLAPFATDRLYQLVDRELHYRLRQLEEFQQARKESRH